MPVNARQPDCRNPRPRELDEGSAATSADCLGAPCRRPLIWQASAVKPNSVLRSTFLLLVYAAMVMRSTTTTLGAWLPTLLPPLHRTLLAAQVLVVAGVPPRPSNTSRSVTVSPFTWEASASSMCSWGRGDWQTC